MAIPRQPGLAHGAAVEPMEQFDKVLHKLNNTLRNLEFTRDMLKQLADNEKQSSKLILSILDNNNKRKKALKFSKVDENIQSYWENEAKTREDFANRIYSNLLAEADDFLNDTKNKRKTLMKNNKSVQNAFEDHMKQFQKHRKQCTNAWKMLDELIQKNETAKKAGRKIKELRPMQEKVSKQFEKLEGIVTQMNTLEMENHEQCCDVCELIHKSQLLAGKRLKIHYDNALSNGKLCKKFVSENDQMITYEPNESVLLWKFVSYPKCHNSSLPCSPKEVFKRENLVTRFETKKLRDFQDSKRLQRPSGVTAQSGQAGQAGQAAHMKKKSRSKRNLMDSSQNSSGDDSSKRKHSHKRDKKDQDRSHHSKDRHHKDGKDNNKDRHHKDHKDHHHHNKDKDKEKRRQEKEKMKAEAKRAQQEAHQAQQAQQAQKAQKAQKAQDDDFGFGNNDDFGFSDAPATSATAATAATAASGVGDDIFGASGDVFSASNGSNGSNGADDDIFGSGGGAASDDFAFDSAPQGTQGTNNNNNNNNNNADPFGGDTFGGDTFGGDTFGGVTDNNNGDIFGNESNERDITEMTETRDGREVTISNVSHTNGDGFEFGNGNFNGSTNNGDVFADAFDEADNGDNGDNGGIDDEFDEFDDNDIEFPEFGSNAQNGQTTQTNVAKSSAFDNNFGNDIGNDIRNGSAAAAPSGGMFDFAADAMSNETKNSANDTVEMNPFGTDDIPSGMIPTSTTQTETVDNPFEM